jgi:3-phenylpropionate/cinnamic acid dioxygenase small subunit
MELLAALYRNDGRESVVTAEATQEGVASPARASMGAVDYPSPSGKQVPVTEPRHLQIVAWLEDESSLLDDDNLTGWLAILAPDIIYRAPVRTTRDHRSKGVFESEMFHFNETIMTLMLKLMRLTQTDTAWSENPLSRTQRIVHKVRAYETDKPDEYEVYSSILLIRSRYDEAALEFLPARRVDVIRVSDDGWKLASRTIYFEQATLGVQNLTIYL